MPTGPGAAHQGPLALGVGCKPVLEPMSRCLGGTQAGQPALDVSFWAFQQMAHPSYGVIMVRATRCVCASWGCLPSSAAPCLQGMMN